MIRFTILSLFVAMACGESHSADDGGPDAARDASADVLGCPPVLPETCVRGDCCDEDPTPAERVPGTCEFRCPTGWVEQSLCDIAPGCGAFDVCADNMDCILASNTCCGVCGIPSLSDFDAINADRADAHRMAVCPVPEPCPDCPSGFNPNLGATCEAGTCRGFDVSTLPLTECSDPSDCRVRAKDCCECGADTSFFNLVAVRVDAGSDYEDLVCPEDFGCPECEPVYPDDVIADCNAGRCELRLAMEP